MDKIYCEKRNYIENGFLQIFPNKIVGVKSFHQTNGESYVELFSDDSDECFMRIRCEDKQSAIKLADEFVKSINKLNFKRIK